MKDNEDLVKKVKQNYMKEWRKNNKDRVKIHNQRYWKKKAFDDLNKRKDDSNDIK